MIGLESGIPYLCGPFLWFYFRLVTGKEQQISWRSLLHLIPFLLHYIYIYVVLISKSDVYKLSLLDGVTSPNQLITLVVSNGLKIAHGLIYYILAYKFLRDFGAGLNGQKSEREQIKLRWLRALMVLLIIVTMVMGLSVVSLLIPQVTLSSLAIPLINVLLFILIYVIVYYALKHPHIFRPIGVSELHSMRYAGSAITEQESRHQWQQLSLIMNVEKPYRKSDLTLADLAEQVSINPKTLSQIINENSGQNFFNFVNKYRVEEFKDRAKRAEDKHLTLVAIAGECGFSSKTSFYSAFKKLENSTPRAYLLSNKSDFRR